MNIDIQRYWGEREIYFVGELCSKIIDSMQKDGTVTLFSKEMRSARVSGLYNLLDQMSLYYKWNKSKIIIKTGNYLEFHDQYTIEFMFEESLSYLATVGSECVRSGIEHRPWNREKTYGMFLGRANVTRIHGVHKHKKFEFSDQGLVSWHHNLQQHIDPLVLNEYLTSTNKTYQEIISVAPFSDIGSLVSVPITNSSAGEVDWNSVYEKIAIELVFETSEFPEGGSLNEKLLRPMIYKKPFMLIAGSNAIKNLKDVIIPNWFQRLDPTIDICFFDNVISNAYDSDQGIHRVDHVFDILRELILTNKVQTILQDCQEGIETNYKFAQTIFNNKHTHSGKHQIFDYNSWEKPNF